MSKDSIITPRTYVRHFLLHHLDHLNQNATHTFHTKQHMDHKWNKGNHKSYHMGRNRSPLLSFVKVPYPGYDPSIPP
jgi:hypothetical protein